MIKLSCAIAVSWVAVASAVEVEPCGRWDDIATNLALPEEVAGLHMRERVICGENDHFFNYYSPEVSSEFRSLSLYLYKRDWAKFTGDGICEAVRREFDDVVAEVRRRQDVESASFELVEKAKHGKIGETDCLTAEMRCSEVSGGAPTRSWALLCSFGGQFLKLRYSESQTDANANPRPSAWPGIVKSIGDLMIRAKRDRALDVYAVADPTNRLAAICRKWVGADNRVSQWAMPNYQADANSLESWHQENHKAGGEAVERVIRNAIALRMEPDRWYYRLACALAVRGEKDTALEALEQAAAARCGISGAVSARQDPELAALRHDKRFEALCSAMEAESRPNANGPVGLAEVGEEGLGLGEGSVFYSLKDGFYTAYLISSNECPIVYVNNHTSHPKVPLQGLMNVVFPQEAMDQRRNAGPADIAFYRFGGSGDESWCPTIVASDKMMSVDKLECALSIPSRFATSGDEANLAFQLECRNVLGIYAAGSDYGAEGIDRFLGHFPGGIAHAGGAEESDKFVRLAAEMILAMPVSMRPFAAMAVPYLVRRAQKFVKTDEDFMSGCAHRPTVRFADVDCKKAIGLAAALAKEGQLTPHAIFELGTVEVATNLTSVTDIFDNEYGRAILAASPYHIAYMVRKGERTHWLSVRPLQVPNCKTVWKLLQGDPDKVRIEAKADGSAKISVDYQTAFDVKLADGSKVKSCRVDVGCFLVDEKGQASSPSIVSFFFMPNETRFYGKDGRLKSIDYTKRQIPGFYPLLCPFGYWKDVFRWSDDGMLLGWTRTSEDERGRVTTNEFTREGYVIDTRDALGRPKDVHLSLRATWAVMLNRTNLTDMAKIENTVRNGSDLDDRNGGLAASTLAWRYAYEGDTDRFGRPLPKDPAPFGYRPELCRRADFEGSGFRLPLLDQVLLGYKVYTGYKHDALDVDVGDVMREDCALALQNEGLVPPKTLKKMRFCPWTPAANDLWKVDVSDHEKAVSQSLWQLADGSCRYSNSDPGRAAASSLSVGDTMRFLNSAIERAAYFELDKSYRRCKAKEAEHWFGDHLLEEHRPRLFVVEGGCVQAEALPEGKDITLAAWQLSPSCFFGVFSYFGVRQHPRQYVFRTVDQASGEVNVQLQLNELPSLAIGNSILKFFDGDPVACNNIAVLLYAGILNPCQYDEDAVTEFLEHAAKSDNATAVYNLGVMAENRGEKSDAARRYAEAKVMRESKRGGANKAEKAIPFKDKD